MLLPGGNRAKMSAIPTPTQHAAGILASTTDKRREKHVDWGGRNEARRFTDAWLPPPEVPGGPRMSQNQQGGGDTRSTRKDQQYFY